MSRRWEVAGAEWNSGEEGAGCMYVCVYLVLTVCSSSCSEGGSAAGAGSQSFARRLFLRFIACCVPSLVRRVILTASSPIIVLQHEVRCVAPSGCCHTLFYRCLQHQRIVFEKLFLFQRSPSQLYISQSFSCANHFQSAHHSSLTPTDRYHDTGSFSTFWSISTGSWSGPQWESSERHSGRDVSVPKRIESKFPLCVTSPCVFMSAACNNININIFAGGFLVIVATHHLCFITEWAAVALLNSENVQLAYVWVRGRVRVPVRVWVWVEYNVCAVSAVHWLTLWGKRSGKHWDERQTFRAAYSYFYGLNFTLYSWNWIPVPCVISCSHIIF